jgi:hypothetical protein
VQVTITHREGETGEVVVRYKTFDQLEFLCAACWVIRQSGKCLAFVRGIATSRGMREIKS